MSSKTDFESNNSVAASNTFKQGNRYCWGGMSLIVFIAMIVFIILCVTVSVMVPVVFIPIAANSAQSILDQSNFVITAMTPVAGLLVDGKSPYQLIQGSMSITDVKSSADGAVAQPAIVDLYFQDKLFGKAHLPQVNMVSPVAKVTDQMILIEIGATPEQMQLAGAAFACTMANPDCEWATSGLLVVEKDVIGTTMYYGSDLNLKPITFEIEH